MKIRLVGAELLHSDGQTDRRKEGWTDRRTDVTKLIFAFRNFAKTPKICSLPPKI